MTRSGESSALRIEWHPDAVADLAKIAVADQRRIRSALQELQSLDDACKRLVPYSGSLKGFWKLRIGDYRLVCTVRENAGQIVLIIYLAHRSRAYGPRGERVIKTRSRE
jgi:mRNA interferase RelE/StbE